MVVMVVHQPTNQTEAVLVVVAPEDSTATAAMVVTGLQVLARLPVDGQETQPGAFVVGRQPFEESGADRGLLIVAAEIQASRAKLIQLLVNAGFAPIGIIAEMAVAGQPLFLVVNETYVGSADARMAALAANGLRAVVAGGYGVPLGLASEPSSKGVRA